jgi:hypothetical protein
MATDGAGDVVAGAGYTLDPGHPVAEQVLGPDIDAASTLKFVQVEVGAVFNPRRIPLSFNVHFRPPNGEETLLGTFGLFPPDNPGTFIVATSGRLQSCGTVIVTLVPLATVNDPSEIRVQLKRIGFLTGNG